MSVPQLVTADVPEPLARLAAAHGVVPDYWGYDGEQRQVSAQTLVAVLEALGVPASSPEKVGVSLEHSVDDEWRQMLPPTVVVREGAAARFAVHVADGEPVEVWIELEPLDVPGFRSTAPPTRERVALEQVDAYVEPRTVDGRAVGRATFELPTDLPLGWHEIHATSKGTQARATLVEIGRAHV